MDSILIDEARTPLIISGPSEESTDKYYRVNRIIPKLIRGEVIEGKEPGQKWTTGDYTVDEKHRTVALTEEGALRSSGCSAWATSTRRRLNMEISHHVQQALKAHVLFHRDKDYLVQDGEVIIVDEFTGRMMPGRRWSDGLHQAIEAKEGVKIERENQTLATITFQNYFRMYKKLAGMTGTAETEAAEFDKIYKLEVTAIPTNQPMIRQRVPGHRLPHGRGEVPQRRQVDQGAARQRAAGAGGHHLGRKIGEACRRFSKKMGVRHEVLNAKNHEREASIVAQAGRKGAVTVSTNMAGRGTDILLGGNAEFLAERQGCARSRVSTPRRCRREELARQLARQIEGADRAGTRRSGRRSAACTSSARSGTNPAASTTSCAAAPDARAIPGARDSICRCRTT